MSRFYQTALAFILIIATAMQCDRTIHVAQELDIAVTPNPIIIIESRAEFRCTIELGGSKKFRQVDSLILEYSIISNDLDSIIGISKIEDLGTSKDQKPLKHTKKFELNNFQLTGEATLMTQIRIHKKEKVRTSERLAIGMLKQENPSER